jgi:hypothetical protein
VSDVVHAADDGAPVAPLDQGDGRVLDLERKEAAARASDDAVQRDLDDASVRDDEDFAVRMSGDDVVELGGDTRFERRGALAAGHDVPVGLFDPACPRLGIALGDLMGAQTLPLAEVDLAQPGPWLGPQLKRRAEDLGRLERTLQVAGVQADERATGESLGEERGLAASFL